MTPKLVKAVIDAAFDRLCLAAQSSREAGELIAQSLEWTRVGEKRHRRHAWVPEGPPRSSVETCARYFLVRYYRDPVRVRNALDAVSLRPDALYGAALRQLLGDVPSVLDDDRFAAIDYKDHLANRPREDSRP